jgi:hypothetical protein
MPLIEQGATADSFTEIMLAFLRAQYGEELLGALGILWLSVQYTWRTDLYLKRIHKDCGFLLWTEFELSKWREPESHRR